MTTTAQERPLCVERVRLTVLREPLTAPVAMSIGVLEARHAFLVEVEVDGVWGTGEVWVNHPAWAWRERLETFRHGVLPLLRGRDVSDPAALLDDLAQVLLPRAEQAGAVGPIWHVLSGLDVALWDALARRQGRCLAEVLSPGQAPPPSTVEVYASGIGPTRVEELCAEARRQGVRAVKARVGFGVATDTATLTTIRATLGEEVALYADANRAWTFEQAVEMSAVLRDLDAAWVEEPLRDDRPDELARLSHATGLQIAAGENLYGRPAFEQYLGHGRLTLIQPDPAKSGGLSTTVAVARAAAPHGVLVSPHCYSGGVALAASVHVAAAFENVPMVELDVQASALRTELLDESWQVRDGRVRVPPGPGLGVRLDPETRARYAVLEEEHVVGGARA